MSSSRTLLQQIKKVKYFAEKAVKKSKNIQQQSQFQSRFTSSASQSLSGTTTCTKQLSRATTSIWNIENQPSSHQQYTLEGITFCLIPAGVDLSVKRCAILEKVIKKRKGIILNLENDEKVDFIIFNQQMLQFFPQTAKSKFLKSILDFHYIIDCQKKGNALPYHHYIIKINESNKQKILKNCIQPKTVKKLHTDSVKEIKKQAQTEEEDLETQYVKNRKCENKQIWQNSRCIPDASKFSCQKGSAACIFATNKLICEELAKIQSIYENQKDIGRNIAYLKAISAIKSSSKQITSSKDLTQIRGIGKKIRQKIAQLFKTGSIEKLQKLKNCSQNRICEQLCQVWGIGTSKANQLIEKGIESLQHLQDRSDLLNSKQKIGLKYFSQFKQRIPRAKVQNILSFIKQQINECLSNASTYRVEICGSYRRGKQTCGDIDVILTRKDGEFQQQNFFTLIDYLEKVKFLTDHLSSPSTKQNERKCLSYMGVCTFETEIHHRIDIKYYPIQQFSFATLYFTGSDMFNRSMRLFARKKGYSLSDHGLFEVERNGGGKIWKGKVMNFYTEQQIFQFLGLDFKKPEQRNI